MIWRTLQLTNDGILFWLELKKLKLMTVYRSQYAYQIHVRKHIQKTVNIAMMKLI
jgi:hypothetical protein